MTLDQLRVLATIQQEGSFSKAAVVLHRSQTALTHAVKALEADLGLPLFDRSGYRARLTPAGTEVLHKARQMLAIESEVTGLAERMREGAEPRLTLVVHDILPMTWLMPLLNEFRAEAWPTQVTVRVAILAGVLEQIERNRPELAITPLGLFEAPASYDVARIGSLTMIPVVGVEHPLARMTPPISLATLRAHLHLIVSDSSERRQAIDYGLIGAPHQWYFPDFHTRLEALRAGIGYAWMPTYLVESSIREGVLKPIVVSGQNVHRFDVGVMYRCSPSLGNSGLDLLRQLQASEHLLPVEPPEVLAIYA